MPGPNTLVGRKWGLCSQNPARDRDYGVKATKRCIVTHDWIFDFYARRRIFTPGDERLMRKQGPVGKVLTFMT